jgi:hypothetical protein
MLWEPSGKSQLKRRFPVVRHPEVYVDALGRCDSANAGRVINKSLSTLANWRTLGIGPAWFKVGGRVYYKHADLIAFGMGEADASQRAA